MVVGCTIKDKMLLDLHTTQRLVHQTQPVCPIEVNTICPTTCFYSQPVASTAKPTKQPSTGQTIDIRRIVCVFILRLQCSIQHQAADRNICKVLKCMLMLSPFSDECTVEIMKNSQLKSTNQAAQLHLSSSATTTSQLSCSTSAHLQQSVSLCAREQHYLFWSQYVA